MAKTAAPSDLSSCGRQARAFQGDERGQVGALLFGCQSVWREHFNEGEVKFLVSLLPVEGKSDGGPLSR